MQTFLLRKALLFCFQRPIQRTDPLTSDTQVSGAVGNDEGREWLGWRWPSESTQSQVGSTGTPTEVTGLDGTPTSHIPNLKTHLNIGFVEMVPSLLCPG